MEKKWIWAVLAVVTVGVAMTIWVETKKSQLETTEPPPTAAPERSPVEPSTSGNTPTTTQGETPGFAGANGPLVSPDPTSAPPSNAAEQVYPEGSAPTAEINQTPPPPPPNYQYPENYDPEGSFPNPVESGESDDTMVPPPVPGQQSGHIEED